MTVEVVARDGGSVVRIRLQPGASRAGAAGVQGGAWKVRVSSPPVDGRANDELCTLLADLLGLRRRQVTVVGGHTSRSKHVWVDLAPDELRSRLALLVGDEASTG